MLAAVREREPGETRRSPRSGSSCSAAGRARDQGRRRGGGGDAAAASVTRVITESPALLARERQVLARYEEALAALLAQETGADPDAAEPRAAANALLGVAPGADRLRPPARARRGRRGAGPREVRAQAKRAFALLEGGLGDYARR